eukprot:TRINITY_DN17434_c0_g1_i1.p1 TRINITY_DN17434_c0_g1~~TRINITY_DN17434_c0_g1_i1.p1  ORF type:complete len:619 (+),score=163.13 TRINITY_DN17434_c0_g1_i1:57-1859(+)
MEPIRVFARIRPKEDSKEPRCFPNGRDSIVIERNSFDQPVFRFHRVFGENTSEQEVFDQVLTDKIKDCFKGYKTSVLCYGQTGSGKTHTIHHLLLKTIEGIFAKECDVKMLYLQVYKEVMTDVVTGETVLVKKDRHGVTNLQNCSWQPIPTQEEAQAFLASCDEKRKTAATQMNASSSRSHACIVFAVTLPTGEQGTLSLIDLAGSEKFAKTQATGERFDEARYINQSLVCLGSVVAGLAAKLPHIPFRESILTRYLEDTLAGHGRAAIIITLHPDARNVPESISTCQFGSRAMKVCTKKPKVQEAGPIDWEAKCKELETQLSGYTDVQNYTKLVADQFELRVENSNLKNKTAELQKELEGVRARTSQTTSLESHLNQSSRRIETLNKKMLEARQTIQKEQAQNKEHKEYIFALEKMVEQLESTAENTEQLTCKLQMEARGVAKSEYKERLLTLEEKHSHVVRRYETMLREKEQVLIEKEEEEMVMTEKHKQAMRSLQEGHDARLGALQKILDATKESCSLELGTMNQKVSAVIAEVTERELSLAREKGLYAADKEATHAVIENFAQKAAKSDKVVKELTEEAKALRERLDLCDTANRRQ